MWRELAIMNRYFEASVFEDGWLTSLESANTAEVILARIITVIASIKHIVVAQFCATASITY